MYWINLAQDSIHYQNILSNDQVRRKTNHFLGYRSEYWLPKEHSSPCKCLLIINIS